MGALQDLQRNTQIRHNQACKHHRRYIADALLMPKQLMCGTGMELLAEPASSWLLGCLGLILGLKPLVGQP